MISYILNFFGTRQKNALAKKPKTYANKRNKTPITLKRIDSGVNLPILTTNNGWTCVRFVYAMVSAFSVNHFSFSLPHNSPYSLLPLSFFPPSCNFLFLISPFLSISCQRQTFTLSFSLSQASQSSNSLNPSLW